MQEYCVSPAHLRPRDDDVDYYCISIENLCDSYDLCGIQSGIPLLLRKLFNALKCIPQNSVESERAFSITGQFVTKLCTKLDDDTLSSLVFLKAFYKNEAPN